MNDRSDPRIVKRLRVFTAAAAVSAVGIGVSALAGWTFRVASLTNWGAPPTSMVANTAACFILIGVALWCVRENENRAFPLARNLAARMSAATAGVVGLLSLAEHIFRLDLGLDQFLLVAPRWMQTATVRPGLMSPITAVAFVLLSVALLANRLEDATGRLSGAMAGRDGGRMRVLWSAELCF